MASICHLGKVAAPPATRAPGPGARCQAGPVWGPAACHPGTRRWAPTVARPRTVAVWCGVRPTGSRAGAGGTPDGKRPAPEGAGRLSTVASAASALLRLPLTRLAHAERRGREAEQRDHRSGDDVVDDHRRRVHGTADDP